MEEGWIRVLKSDKIDVYSAGIETHRLNPHVVKMMREVGIDIPTYRSANVREYLKKKRLKMLLLLPYRTVGHDFFSGTRVFCSLRLSINTHQGQ